MWYIILSYVGIITAGIGVYYAYTRLMPKEWRASLASWKTNTLGAIVGFAPDAMNLLSMLQSVGDSWAPSETVTWVMRGIGVAIIVLRWITSYEQSEDL